MAPTTSTVPPMTAEELAWLKAVTSMHKKIDRVIQQSATLTGAKMMSDANSFAAAVVSWRASGPRAIACSRSM